MKIVGYMLTGQRKVRQLFFASEAWPSLTSGKWNGQRAFKLAGIRAEQMSGAGEAVYRNWRHIAGDGSEPNLSPDMLVVGGHDQRAKVGLGSGLNARGWEWNGMSSHHDVSGSDMLQGDGQ